MDENIQKTRDQSDTLFSTKYQAHYHSIHGALEESIHVFISAGLYHMHRKGLKELSIFEMGFGTGLNCFLTLIESKQLDIQINYTSIESDPISLETATGLNYTELIHDEHRYFRSLHEAPINKEIPITNAFNLTKTIGQLETYQSVQPLDLIYYDAFAPSTQPHLWTPDIHQKLYDFLKPGGALVTYCSQGAFRRMLQSLGYKIEKLNGPGKKREMLRATKL